VVQWGYARVSRVDQDSTPQFDALRRAGVEDAHMVVDHASGSQDNRPGLLRLLEQLKAGDVLTVWKLDRLGRSLPHLIATIDDLGERGVEFRSLTDPIDTTTAGGRLMFAVIGAVAQFERELIQERTRAALLTARDRQVTLGRPTQVNEHQYRSIRRLHRDGESHARIAAATGLSKSVVGRVLRGEIASLAPLADAMQRADP
jgi:DNA invertase Pin-like site-specific DNA recombinase